MDPADLMRVRIDTAQMAFVIGDSNTRDPDHEDQDNTLRAISIHRIRPSLRMRFMLIRPANKMRAIAVGLPPTMCYALNELKANLLSQSCRCEGYATLVNNLMVTDKETVRLSRCPDELAEQPHWLQEYIKGAQCEVVGFVFRDEHIGQSFAHVAREIYGYTSNVLLACQDREGLVKIFPYSYEIVQGDIGFVVTNDANTVAQEAKLIDPTTAESVRYKSKNVVDYKPLFSQKQTPVVLDGMRKDLMRFVFDDAKTRNPTARTAAPPRKFKAKTRFLLPFAPRREEPKEETPAITAVVESTNDLLLDTTQLAKETQKKKESEKAKAIGFVNEGGHILLLVCQPELSWQQIKAFIMPLRAPYLPETIPIVVLLSVFPPKDMWDAFDDVAWLLGSPESTVDIAKAGAATASKIIMLAGPPQAVEPRLADANAIMVSATVENLMLEAGNDSFALYEFAYPSNISVLYEYPQCSLPKRIGNYKDFRNDKKGIDEDALMHQKLNTPVHLLPRYAGGRVLVSSLLGSLYAQAYSTPGILELTEAMTMPSRRRQVSYPWLIDVPQQYQNVQYGVFVDACLENGLEIAVNPEGEKESILPIGILRQGERTPYVYTNPAAEIQILATDKVYVFASQAWGHAMTYRAVSHRRTVSEFDLGCVDTTVEIKEEDKITEEEAEKAKETVHRLFDRYDLDKSGTLNSIDELRMMTINTIYKLGLQVTQPEIEDQLVTFQRSNPAVTKEVFCEWFGKMHPSFKRISQGTSAR